MLTNAERQARHRERVAARIAAQLAGLPSPPAQTKTARQPPRPTQWATATATLTRLLDEYEVWLERMPEAQQDGPTGEAIAALLELRELVDELAAAPLPSGFGRPPAPAGSVARAGRKKN